MERASDRMNYPIKSSDITKSNEIQGNVHDAAAKIK
jgi:hypothetical protein